jgi:FAD dependent oxidoreductase
VSSADVVVYGATAAGVTAAAAARAAGATVTLVEPGPHVGGMVSGGLSWTDVGDARVIGGLARRFYQSVADHYRAPLWAVKGPEPHVAERLLTGLLDGVDVRLGETAVPDAAAYVDASYEGDLMATRRIPYAIGRESRDRYGERWAGRQPATRPSKHNFPVLLSPFDDGELLPAIRAPDLDDRGWPDDAIGEADGGLQAYGFRVCLTDRPENRRGLEPPSDYDPAEFELLRRYVIAMDDRLEAWDLLGLVPDLLPNGKCDVNSIGPFSLNVLDGSNRDYPDGHASRRAGVREHHLRYTQALLCYLAHDVPSRKIQAEMSSWGPCIDEFETTDGWPHQLYVRDGRRMLGAYVLCERDLLDARPQPDTVALGSYNIDLREVERTWRYLPEYERQAAVFNEGYLSVAVPLYPIPYRSLTPRREDATDVLVPGCLSASHVAFGSVRMEPTLMMLGYAAGAAAAQAARRGVAVQDVDVAALQQELREGGQVLTV